MNGPLVLAFGSTLRGDDGAGAAALELLGASGLGGRARLLHLQQAVPELAASVAASSLLVVVDARADTGPGEVGVAEITPETSRPAPFSHEVSPAALLALASALFGAAPPGFAVTVGASSFGFGDALSPAVAAALPALCRRVEELIDSRNRDPRPQAAGVLATTNA